MVSFNHVESSSSTPVSWSSLPGGQSLLHVDMWLSLIRVLIPRGNIPKFFIEPLPRHLTRQRQLVQLCVFKNVLLKGFHDQTSQSGSAGARKDGNTTDFADGGGVFIETGGSDALVGRGIERYPVQAFRVNPFRLIERGWVGVIGEFKEVEGLVSRCTYFF